MATPVTDLELQIWMNSQGARVKETGKWGKDDLEYGRILLRAYGLDVHDRWVREGIAALYRRSKEEV